MKMYRWRTAGDRYYLLEVVEVPWRALPATLLADLTCGRGRHHLCQAPSWTYEVGLGPWREWPDNRANLGNVWWAFGQRVLNLGDVDRPGVELRAFRREDVSRLVRLWLRVSRK